MSHSAGMGAFIYMSMQDKDLLVSEGDNAAPMNGNVGTIMCVTMAALGIVACYYGPDAKKNKGD